MDSVFQSSNPFEIRTKNKASANQHPPINDKYLMIYPLAAFIHRLHHQISILTVSGQSTLILDLCSPLGSSDNYGIRLEDLPLQYIQVDNLIKLVCRCGCGAFMAKIDVDSAYRNVAIHPSDRYLLGMKWRGTFYRETLQWNLSLRVHPWDQGKCPRNGVWAGVS